MKQEGCSIPSVAGPISKAVPRGNVSLDGSFWHKDAEVNMKFPGSQNLGNACRAGVSLGREQSLWGRRRPHGAAPGGGGGGGSATRAWLRGALGRRGEREQHGEDVRKAGDSYSPACTLNLASTIQMRKNTVDWQEKTKGEF